MRAKQLHAFSKNGLLVLVVPILIICSLLLIFVSSLPWGGKVFANQVFEDINVSRVLAYKKVHWGGYGCTFVVVRLSERPSEEPPRIRIQRPGNSPYYVKTDVWQSTPVDPAIELASRKSCLTGGQSSDAPPADGLGMDGYGDEIWDILQRPNAWYALHGSGEHQVMHVYAPEYRLAVRLRYGD